MACRTVRAFAVAGLLPAHAALLAAGCGSGSSLRPAHAGAATSARTSTRTGAANSGSPEQRLASAARLRQSAHRQRADPGSAAPVRDGQRRASRAGGCLPWAEAEQDADQRVPAGVSFVPVVAWSGARERRTDDPEARGCGRPRRCSGPTCGSVRADQRPAAARRSRTSQGTASAPPVAVIPPQVVLISANGRKLIPRLPASGCGLTQSQVLLALNELRWQPVSVRLIAKVPGASAPAVSGTAPRSIQTVGGSS